MNPIIENVYRYVKSELEWLCIAHDFHHIERVWKLSKKIHAGESAWDIVVIELAALLHESFDDKFYTPEQLREKEISLRAFLLEQWLEESLLDRVFFVIENVWYGKSLKRGIDFAMSPELEIVEDADRLEAIGAIAIARTFSYGGKKNRAIHEPDAINKVALGLEPYRNNSGSSIQHFYDKLLKLKGLLHTDFARKLAENRHAFMEEFLEQFFKEWNLEA